MYLLFDMGRTKIRISSSKDLSVFSDPLIFDTPKNFTDGIDLLVSTGEELLGDEKLEAVAGGASRALWNGENILTVLKKEFNCPIFFENDSALVGLGEAYSGAGRGSSILAYITISSGVGGVRIVNGKIDISSVGFEPGHQIINFDDQTFCTTCNNRRGHLEGYISGLAVKDRMGTDPETIKDKKFWDQIAKYLAYGLNNTIVHWSPDTIVLGGSMMKSPGIDISAVKTHLEQITTIYPNLPNIKVAELGDIGGIYGAKELIRQNLVDD